MRAAFRFGGRGLSTFVEVGKALLAIRGKKHLYANYGTFEAYCRERWGMSKSHANRMIQGADIVQVLGPIGPTPTNESTIRPLTRLPKSELKGAWRLSGGFGEPVRVGMD